ncbi:hypothetical protein EPA93_00050 [Ktedonosporobacter rubrisoli]|uniref:Uncharacterized protein n=1 Tax=Ktedonosporobacter rubrisoli TaxID=2509675 RepID=A0A4P6JHH7_KTERU|nr:hypothetical protein [Ktedonosporobacter rubrisoli]QBD74469.1 hypothetical protein EPA93_00050 [Ktedonosporobacter rubrisoli]
MRPKKRSILNCLPQQKTLFDAEMERRSLAHQHELVGALLNEAAWYRQMDAELSPLSEALQASTPLGTLRSLIAVYQGEKQDVAVSTHLQQRWGCRLTRSMRSLRRPSRMAIRSLSNTLRAP